MTITVSEKIEDHEQTVYYGGGNAFDSGETVKV